MNTRHSEGTVQAAINAYVAGSSPGTLAEQLGVSYYTILFWLKRAGVYNGLNHETDRVVRIREANKLRDERLAQQREARFEKVCAECHQSLPVSEFYPIKGRARLHPYCKACCVPHNKSSAEKRKLRDETTRQN